MFEQMTPATPQSDQAAQWRQAIAGIESAGSGGYSALGPVTKSGDRAYGKYQVMGQNIGPWTREILGREMSAREFMADERAQDAVFDGKFGQSVQKYGNPQDAASVWFTGRPRTQGAGATDILGTTGAQYVDKFNSGLGIRPPAGPPLDATNGKAAGQQPGGLLAALMDAQENPSPMTKFGNDLVGLAEETGGDAPPPPPRAPVGPLDPATFTPRKTDYAQSLMAMLMGRT